MYICTCNNCGNLYEDTNPSGDSIDYPNEFSNKLVSDTLTDQQGKYHNQEVFKGCPICKTDSFLVDNINLAAIK